MNSTKPQDERRLMAVFAHPDDETFGTGGTLALYAQQGADVVLVCATRGEVGSLPEEMAGWQGDLAALRENELRCAAGILGLNEVIFLDYRDSGMPGSDDNNHPDALVAQETETVAERIVPLIQQYQPQVIITFDPIGGYKHPDHIAIQRATEVAFHKARAETTPYQPQKLYYHTFPRTLLKLLVRVLSFFGGDPQHYGRNRDIDLLDLTETEYPIHARINYRPVVKLKETASACHHSQLDPVTRSPLRILSRIFGSTETFMRAYPPADNAVKETDLFQGIDLNR
jgi:LmbE family N-acetylglucosaminyl deacetylase